MTTELEQLAKLYEAMTILEERCGGFQDMRALGRQGSRPSRGVYFFFEPNELRRGTGAGPRIVRVGTHGLVAGKQATIWTRLRAHYGTRAGGGNHRGSVFRKHVGEALMTAGKIAPVPGWQAGGTAAAAQRLIEEEAERAVSEAIGRMRFLWLRVDDEPGPGSDRGLIERGAIALLSSAAAREADPPSSSWLGHHARAPEISTSGLWNVQGIGRPTPPDSLDRLWHWLERQAA